MRAFPYSAIVIGCLSQIANGQEMHPDFSGVYMPQVFVGSPTLIVPEVFPLTPAGQDFVNSYSRFDEERQDNDCTPESMPGVLWLGAAMELSVNDGVPVFHYERGDSIRTIVMNGDAPAGHPASRLGYSSGSWDGDTLVIHTTHLNGGTLVNNRAIPMSSEATLTERYWRDSGSNDLNVELTVDDPVYYTESFAMSRVLVFSPDDALQEWVCVNLGSRDEAPDIDELTRMLEEL